MTITVTVEELREYQAKCERWTKERGIFVEQLILQSRREHRDLMFLHERSGAHISPEMRATLQKWEAENPFPKLIPAV
jgi:hypothetical protein